MTVTATMCKDLLGSTFVEVQELLRQLDTINGTIRALDEAVHGRAILKLRPSRSNVRESKASRAI